MVKMGTRSNYGTISEYVTDNLDEERGQLISPRDTESTKHIKRWSETFLYLIPLFLGIFAMEGCKLLWKDGDPGDSFAGSMWVGFGAAIGALIGRIIRAFFIMRSPFFRVSYEIDEGFVVALSLMFGPSSSYFPLEYWLASRNVPLVVSFIVMFLVAMLSYFGSPLIFRSMLALANDERHVCIQSKQELWNDLLLSTTVGLGFAFMVFNSEKLSSHSLFSLLQIDESNDSFVAMLMYGFLFSIGYFASQTLQNIVLEHTWTDGNN